MRNHLLLLLALAIFVSIACAFVYFTAFQQVEAPAAFSSVKEAYVECIERATDDEIANCLDTLAEYTYANYEVSAVAAELNTLSFQEKNRWCHEMMHYLGWKAYIAENDIARAFLNSSELCDSGMYHGVMEEFLRQEGLAGDLETLVKNACTDSLSNHPDLSLGTLSLCYHGLGHGLMYVTSSDLQSSLDYCDVLEPSQVSNCYSGAFMEYTASKEIGPISNAKDLKDHAYCQELRDHQKQDCYNRQGINNYSATGGNLGEAMQLCLEIDPAGQNSCFHGVGSNTPAPGKSHADSGRECIDALQVSQQAYTACIYGALSFVTQLDRGGAAGVDAFCTAIKEQYKKVCYTAGGSLLREWLTSKETIEEKCSSLQEKEAQQYCIEGAQ